MLKHCLSVVAMLVLAMTATAKGDTTVVDGWARTRATSGCLTSYTRMPPPIMELRVAKDEKVDLALRGISATNEQVLAGSYPAEILVQLNGRTIFSKSTRKAPRMLELAITFKDLEALTSPGQIVFDVKGDSGQREKVTYSSPGLSNPLAFLRECLAK